MSSFDREILKDIFAEAIEMPAGSRSAYLKDRCSGDAALYDEIVSLLAASDVHEHLIEVNALDPATGLGFTNEMPADKKFGNYRIVREIGHGGMGTVFLAVRDDGEFTQQVALKIVRQSIADSQIIERFRNERQILAGLNHPNIAALYDGGVTEIGEPFMAMEYVDGQSLIEYANSQSLPVDARLKLFAKVCLAVAFAHRNLIIHRDIKPSNIVVTAGGEPKLLDFGLAKAFEGDTAQTRTAIRAFTPAYASPEQILGRAITTASDIYSLGVVFFELLTGEKPLALENKSFEEILHTINTGRPALPSEVAEHSGNAEMKRLLKGDLDNIALMALRKEPERRYGSAEEFAQDIENYLNDLPVRARPNTFGYLSRKFVQRNRLAVAAAALIVISLIIGLAFALWQADIARRERDRAEKRFRDVRQLSNSLLFEITPKIEDLLGATEAREAVVTRALEYLDSLAAESADDQSLQAELAAAYEKVGDLQGNPDRPNLSNFTGAVESYGKARSIRERLPQTPDNRRRLANNLQIASLIRFRQNDIAGSISDSQAALAIYGELRASEPTTSELALAAIYARIEYAQIYSMNNQYTESVPIFREALAELASLDQMAAETQKLKTKAHIFLGNALSWDGRQPEAETEIANAITICDRLSGQYPNDPAILTLAWQTYQIASSVMEDTDNARSLSYARTSLSAAQKAVAADKADGQARYNLAKAYSRAGIAYAKLNRAADARASLEKGEEILTRLIAEEPRNVIYQRDLAKLYVRMGDASEKENNIADALLKYQNSAVIFEKIGRVDSANTLAQRDLAQSLKSVGLIQKKLAQYQNSKQNLDRALAILIDLKAKNALGKYDEKMIAEIEGALSGI